MGNRGILHDEHQTIVRPYQHRAWIVCRLEFKGRRREIMAPGKYTELFFLDEATALAAGHRPCYECRRENALAFRAAWVSGQATIGASMSNGGKVRAAEIDRVLHQERLTSATYVKDRDKRTYYADLDMLPDGAFIVLDGEPALVWGERLFPWTTSGYRLAGDRPVGITVTLLTPPSIVAALAAGYVPRTADLAPKPD